MRLFPKGIACDTWVEIKDEQYSLWVHITHTHTHMYFCYTIILKMSKELGVGDNIFNMKQLLETLASINQSLD